MMAIVNMVKNNRVYFVAAFVFFLLLCAVAMTLGSMLIQGSVQIEQLSSNIGAV